MRKSVGLSIIALAFAALPSFVLAQSPCGCGSTAQTYQRYSYQPAPQATVVQSAPVASQPATVVAPAQVVTAPVATQARAYRRFSYQPQASRPIWEYAKGDSRRYRP
jgi:hypothetical protein